jgi:hypothetical protein
MPKFKSIPHEVTAVQWQGSVTLELRELFGPRSLAVRSDPLRLFRPTLVVPQDGDSLAEVGEWVVRTDYDEELGFDLDVMEPEDFGASYRPVLDDAERVRAVVREAAVEVLGSRGLQDEAWDDADFADAIADRAVAQLAGGAPTPAVASTTSLDWVQEVVREAGLEFNIAIPAILTSASGEAPTDIRVRLAVGRPSPDILALVVAQLLPHIKDPVMIIGCARTLCAELDLDALIRVRDAVEGIMAARSHLD